MSRMQELWNTSFLSGNSMEYVESLYDDFCRDPSLVSNEWQQIFSSMPKNSQSHESLKQIEAYFRDLKPRLGSTTENDQAAKNAAYLDAYRRFGHLAAHINPLDERGPERPESLTPAYYGLSEASVDPKLAKTYCASIGYEFMHISDVNQRQWWINRIEGQDAAFHFSAAEQQKILQDLIAADGFERYLHTRFVGQKRFSLEGGDALIPMLADLMKVAASKKVAEVLIGMAHRGRLNVLVNILGKSPQSLYDEFEGKGSQERTGDVKYHLGFSSHLALEQDQSIAAFLAFNPSHLEIIGPVVEGAARSRLTIRDDLQDKSSVLPVIIHGDSAFIGQGVVMETFNFSQARYYSTGGSIHIVINNQVGFTTSNPNDTRSSRYCTDIAKMIEAPVLHVNGDDPQAVVACMRLAMEYRSHFHRDVVIDLVCYRRQGHNEADEPALTQPHMYQMIRSRPVLRDLYAKHLEQTGVIDASWYEQQVAAYRDKMDLGHSLVPLKPKDTSSAYRVDWKQYYQGSWRSEVKTGVEEAKLQQYMETLSVVPENFKLHPVVERTRQERMAMMKGEQLLNWGCAETLAFASILASGYEVRLSGQDCGRGTFSHRHAVWHDQNSDNTLAPLERFQVDKAHPFTVIDSVLSEEGILAFEYGYAATNPEALVIWEAQFGDFANGAQVVIDQFISSGEQKWGRLCGLVMFLPHGYEGQGPEHSSARLERFMQLCAQQNMQVCVPSTPAQIFHLIRRQMLRPYRKPLIVMTPKSLLRHKRAVSSIDDLVHGHFHNVLPDTSITNTNQVKRVVLCSGKVYYDLLQAREDLQRQDTALIRIEQLYPFPSEELSQELGKYQSANEVIWCQEEPQNQGAWFTSQHHMLDCLRESQKLRYAGRDFAAAPSVGSYGLHQKQQQAFIEQVFG